MERELSKTRTHSLRDVVSLSIYYMDKDELYGFNKKVLKKLQNESKVNIKERAEMVKKLSVNAVLAVLAVYSEVKSGIHLRLSEDFWGKCR